MAAERDSLKEACPSFVTSDGVFRVSRVSELFSFKKGFASFSK
jgi:hypothetical protein